ncbi:hypothetical protein ABBQ38_006467 [Trebouxia sp. C0009 RCD-2024]
MPAGMWRLSRKLPGLLVLALWLSQHVPASATVLRKQSEAMSKGEAKKMGESSRNSLGLRARVGATQGKRAPVGRKRKGKGAFILLHAHT